MPDEIRAPAHTMVVGETNDGRAIGDADVPWRCKTPCLTGTQRRDWLIELPLGDNWAGNRPILLDLPVLESRLSTEKHVHGPDRVITRVCHQKKVTWVLLRTTTANLSRLVFAFESNLLSLPAFRQACRSPLRLEFEVQPLGLKVLERIADLNQLLALTPELDQSSERGAPREQRSCPCRYIAPLHLVNPTGHSFRLRPRPCPCTRATTGSR